MNENGLDIAHVINDAQQGWISAMGRKRVAMSLDDSITSKNDYISVLEEFLHTQTFHKLNDKYEGYFYMDNEYVAEAWTLPLNTVKRAKKYWVEAGVISVNRKKTKNTNNTYRIEIDNFVSFLKSTEPKYRNRLAEISEERAKRAALSNAYMEESKARQKKYNEEKAKKEAEEDMVLKTVNVGRNRFETEALRKLGYTESLAKLITITSRAAKYYKNFDIRWTKSALHTYLLKLGISYLDAEALAVEKNTTPEEELDILIWNKLELMRIIDMWKFCKEVPEKWFALIPLKYSSNYKRDVTQYGRSFDYINPTVFKDLSDI